LKPYKGRIKALIEILSFKQGGQYANVELLENLIMAEDKNNHNWAIFVMKSFRQQMNLAKWTDKRLANFKGAEWIDVLLQQIWTEDALVEGVESKNEVNVEGNDSSAPRHLSPVVLLDTPSTNYGSNNKTDGGQRQTASKPSTL
jgi:hypothetical protein